MRKMSLGVDLHKKQFTVYFLSEDHMVRELGVYETGQSGYERFLGVCADLEQRGFELHAAVETTGNARYFCSRLVGSGIEVTVVNTLKFKVIIQSVKKTDRHDARILAEFLEKNMLPESHLCSRESEEIRRLLKVRRSLVQTMVSVKNQIHGMLTSYGIESRGGQLQSKKDRQRILCGLADHEFGGNAAAAIASLFETIDQLDALVKRQTQLLQTLVAEDEDVALLMSIPGVGIITASTIRAYVDDIRRFGDAKQFASYMGLAPWVQNSAESVRHGHITRRGPMDMRTAMVQCVLGMVRMKAKTGSYRLMRQYQELKRRKGSGQAIIAIARKLSTIMYTMLKTREPFDPIRMAQKKKYLEMQAAALDAANSRQAI
ncbi:MAG: IS110 family transposase [Sphaerochaetaceae bacterium]|jgi:transposase|nr:IS110 family transposase [Sphaerochaetaceae bacterium]